MALLPCAWPRCNALSIHGALVLRSVHALHVLQVRITSFADLVKAKQREEHTKFGRFPLTAPNALGPKASARWVTMHPKLHLARFTLAWLLNVAAYLVGFPKCASNRWLVQRACVAMLHAAQLILLMPPPACHHPLFPFPLYRPPA